ncbi:MAG: cytochrome c oxidase assembly protein [Rhodospirillales bacterium]|nr:cytochrome c oxidase assembly protein [Rhodospirillales bacterium]
MPRPPRSRFGRLLTLAGLLLAVGGMTTLVSYSVTLYRLFCAATGALGTTQRVAADNAALSSRTVTVTFDTNVAPDLPWKFTPVQSQVRVHLGQSTLVFFRAENLSDQTIVGHAAFNVAPGRVGPYFKKIQCFCFTEERLGPHQSVEMPVQFFVDPRMAKDPEVGRVDLITLSYTFFRSMKPKGATNLARFIDRPASPAAGAQVFAEVCSDCHRLHHAKVGPPLAGVFGRRAGSVPGYPYSPALAHAGFDWNTKRLEAWLADPQKAVPGAEMPYHLDDSLRRRDVIAYLRSLSATGQAAPRKPAKPPARS